MKFTILREQSTLLSTPGVMLLDGMPRWKTLEDIVRELPQLPNETDEQWVRRWKVYGQTAIPARTYRVKMSYSHKFRKELPEIQNVPGFTGIRIHGGRLAIQSLGCPLVGVARNGSDEILGGLTASAAVSGAVYAAERRKEEVWIEIVNAEKFTLPA